MRECERKKMTVECIKRNDIPPAHCGVAPAADSHKITARKICMYILWNFNSSISKGIIKERKSRAVCVCCFDETWQNSNLYLSACYAAGSVPFDWHLWHLKGLTRFCTSIHGNIICNAIHPITKWHRF